MIFVLVVVVYKVASLNIIFYPLQQSNCSTEDFPHEKKAYERARDQINELIFRFEKFFVQTRNRSLLLLHSMLIINLSLLKEEN